MTKFLGIILASIFSVILIVQVEQVRAQVADTPITGPITSPITGPMTSPTDSPTPTLISTVTSTPTLTGTVTPTPSMTVTPTPSTGSVPTASPTITTTPTPTYTVTPTPTNTLTPTVSPTPSATPTPLPSNAQRLGGLNLDGYCAAVGNNWDTVVHGDWYCGNGSAKIDMTSACQWQNARTDTFAFQDLPGDVYSWSCYATTPNVTPTPSVLPTATPTVVPTESMTVTPTPSDAITATPTPSINVTVTPTDMLTETPIPSNHDNHDRFPFHFQFHGFPFDAILNGFHMSDRKHDVQQKKVISVKAEACTNHDNDNKRFK